MPARRGSRKPGLAKEAARSRVKRMAVSLGASALSKWTTQREKLLRAIEGVESTPTMQGPEWKEGQLRHFRRLLANLDASKPTE